FLPAIELLKQHLELVEVEGGVDYRLRLLEKGGEFHFPVDAAADKAMATSFEAIAGVPGSRNVELDIEGRPIKALRVGPGVAWFAFDELCDGPRGQPDYIELSRRYHTVLISAVRRIGATDADRRRRFTWLVDEFYDRRVKLIMSAETPVSGLLEAAPAEVEVQRTASRIWLNINAFRGARALTSLKAYRIFSEDSKVAGRYVDMRLDELDAGEVVIKVAYSSVNFKDALAATGAGKIIRRFPCVGGIDLSGTVVESADVRFRKGDSACDQL